MSHSKEADLLQALLDEGDYFDLESGGSEPGSVDESEHLGIQSDTNSELDAEMLSSDLGSDNDVPFLELRPSRQRYYTGKDKITKW